MCGIEGYNRLVERPLEIANEHGLFQECADRSDLWKLKSCVNERTNLILVLYKVYIVINLCVLTWPMFCTRKWFHSLLVFSSCVAWF